MDAAEREGRPGDQDADRDEEREGNDPNDDERDADRYVRGVDVFRIREGKIAEKRSYVKG